MLFVRGLGVALATIPAMTAGFAAVTADHLSDAAPILNVLQRTGASIGTALLTVLYSSHVSLSGNRALAAEGFRYTSWCLFAVSCLLVLPCILLGAAEQLSRLNTDEDPLVY